MTILVVSMPMGQNMTTLQLSNLKPHKKIEFPFLNSGFKSLEENILSTQCGIMSLNLANICNSVGMDGQYSTCSKHDCQKSLPVGLY